MGYIKKVCLLGDPAVGKTSLVQRYVYDRFDDKYLSTIGTKPSVKNLTHKDEEVTLTIWDIAGQETFQNVHNSYFNGASGAILVCDISRSETIESLTHWTHWFHQSANEAPIILVSNKWDLVESEEEGVKLNMEKDILSFLKLDDCVYMRASAKENMNIEEIFKTLVEKIMD
jgi:small GTP-binding protein